MKEECRYEGMTDEQIAAYELAMRRKATAAMPIEDLVAKLIPQHEAQLINYLCTTGIEHGLLINFGSPKFEIAKRIYTKKPSGA